MVKRNDQGNVKVFNSGLAPDDTIKLLATAIYTYADNQHLAPKELAKLLHEATDKVN